VAILRAGLIDAAAFRNEGLSLGDLGDSEALDPSSEKTAVAKEGTGVAEMARACIECGATGEDVPSGAELATALSANVGSGCCSAIALQSTSAGISRSS
jgi:hypothetical protein